MTVQLESGVVPEVTRGDRMRIALRFANIGIQDVANYLGVARNTVSTWINDHNSPSRQTLMLWALKTGVSLEWLETGQAPAGGPGPDEARSEGFEPPTF